MKHRSEIHTDVWSEWLLQLRHADDPTFAEAVRVEVERYADRVLDAARLAPGMTLADIGSGDGLVAFRAIGRIGQCLRVVIADVSESMLAHAQSRADTLQVQHQCTFLRCSAERLVGLDDASVDVVTTRAVLAYVADKCAALRDFHRVLKPGGRISLAEPILQDEAFAATALRTMIDTKAVLPQDHFLPLLHRWKAAQYPDTHEKIANNPISNWSERNLFDFVRLSGFVDIHLELHIDMMPSIVNSWEVFLGISPHPWAPPLRTVLHEHFTAEERHIFEQVMRPTVESPDAVTTTRIAYLSAVKPQS